MTTPDEQRKRMPDDGWKSLREWARTADHMNVHGATIHALFEDYDAQAKMLDQAEELLELALVAIPSSLVLHETIAAFLAKRRKDAENEQK